MRGIFQTFLLILTLFTILNNYLISIPWNKFKKLVFCNKIYRFYYIALLRSLYSSLGKVSIDIDGALGIGLRVWGDGEMGRWGDSVGGKRIYASSSFRCLPSTPPNALCPMPCLANAQFPMPCLANTAIVE
ncbi:hypothetical protein NIES25_10060 [Nostoc linckia NIES-25]|nr:hypothetical protein NIES25_10060 [Nostoc linckia NIES-25]